MHRFSFLLTLFAFIVLFSACSSDPGPVTPPCTGADCPQPCKDAGAAKISFIPSGGFTSTSALKSCYTPGEQQTASLFIKPTTADFNAPRTVVVFDVVRVDETKKYPSVVTQVLNVNSVSISPDVFRSPVATSTLTPGLEANFSFETNRSAPTGDFLFVISFFRLQDGQTPNQVTRDPNALAGRVFYAFKIEK